MNFQQIFKYSEQNKVTKCLIDECEKQYAGYHASTLRRHLKSTHNDIYNQLSRIKKQRRKRVIVIPEKSSEIRLALVELCTKNGRPFSILNDSGLKKILNLVACNCGDSSSSTDANAATAGGDGNGAGTTSDEDDMRNNDNPTDKLSGYSMYHLVRDIGSACLHIKSLIRKEVKNIFVSVMVDIRSKHGKSILGIQIQYVIDNKIKLRTIGMIRMLQSHTGSFIATLIKEKLAEYNITLNQVYTLTTDNGSNMLKACSLLENIAAVDENDELSPSGLDEEIDTLANYLNIEDLLINDDDEEEESVLFNDRNLNAAARIIVGENNQIQHITGISCGAHTLQLEIVDSINKWELKYGLLAKCREIMTKLRTQNILAIINLKQLKVPILDCLTRWGSQYLMVNDCKTDILNELVPI